MRNIVDTIAIRTVVGLDLAANDIQRVVAIVAVAAVVAAVVAVAMVGGRLGVTVTSSHQHASIEMVETIRPSEND